MPQIFANFLAMSLGGSLLALLLYGLKLVLGRKLSSSVYYYLWLAVLLRFVLPVPGLIPVEPEKTVIPAMEYVERGAVRVYDEVIHQRGGMISAFEPREIDAQNPDASIQASAEEMETPFKDFRFPPVDIWHGVMFVYAALLIVRLTAYIIAYLRFCDALGRSLEAPGRIERRLYEAHSPKNRPELMCSAAVKTPMLMGLFFPRLILPAEHHSVEELNCIYRHELMHYRRGDILYKWFAVLVFSLQWFNPLCILIRREINRSCELSCDEMLIARMDRHEKQAYGNTLISLAASGALPAGVIATTFATEKRDLKERLEQIMKYKNKSLARVFTMLLALVLLIGCGSVLGPGSTAQADESVLVMPETQGETDKPIRVSTVDELLAAIGPDRQIWLEPGVYELDKAADYGGAGGEYYSWNECYDGWELVINDVQNMQLGPAAEGEVSITALARYANVLRFNSCHNIMLNGLTLGHDEEPGTCSGGVVYLSNSDYVHIDSCALYGCGIIGVQAENCTKVFISSSDIYDCSTSAVTAYSCYDLRVMDCDIYDCDAAWGGGIFETGNTTGFAVVNCDIYDTISPSLLTNRYSQQTVFLGNRVKSCNFGGPLFVTEGYAPVVDGCEIADDVFFAELSTSYEGEALAPVDQSGAELDYKAIKAMNQREMSYEGPQTAEDVELDVAEGEDGMRCVKVTNVDEFLAAIGPDTMIELVGDVFDLSTAADYGAYGRQYYYWNNAYDGPELVISGVENLVIVGDGVTIAAIPRYANVINFINCSGIELIGFTAGHTEEPGSCSGGVLNFQNCNDVTISACHLFGCGILGISAQGCEDFLVANTEIYECSNGAIWLGTVENFIFENCDIHDCAKPEISLHDVRDVSYNDQLLVNGMYAFKNGVLEEMVW